MKPSCLQQARKHVLKAPQGRAHNQPDNQPAPSFQGLQGRDGCAVMFKEV